MPLSLEDQLLIQQGDTVEDIDMVKGRSIEIWMRPIVGNALLPTVYTVTASTDAAIGDTTISVTADAEFTIYRNDVLKFSGGTIAIVKATTTITTSSTTVPVFALGGAIAGTTTPETARTYGMIPVWSAKEGAYPQASASYAEAHNKNMGLYAISQKMREDYTATISGDVNFKDPALEMFEQMQTASLSKIFVQARHAVTTEITVGNTTYRWGEGPGAVQYKGNATINLSDGEAAMVGFSMEVKVSGKIDKYRILT